MEKQRRGPSDFNRCALLCYQVRRAGAAAIQHPHQTALLYRKHLKLFHSLRHVFFSSSVLLPTALLLIPEIIDI